MAKNIVALLIAAFCSACAGSPSAPTASTPAPARTTQGLPIVISGQSNAANLWYYAFYGPDFYGRPIYPKAVTCEGCLANTPIRMWAPGTELWSKLEAGLHQPLTAVVLWEGETDGQQGNTHFAADLRDWIGRIRSANGNPNLLIVVVQLLPWPSYEGIRSAQAEVAAGDRNVLLVNVDDLPRADESHPSVDSGYAMSAQRILAAIATRY